MLVAGLMCILLTLNIGKAETVFLAEENPVTAALPTDGGLTRNTLEEAARSPVSAAAPPRSHRVMVRHRSKTRFEAGRRVAGRARRRRNVFESFVYWWNGWVIHHFHTHSGTVMIDRIGFKA